MNGITDRIGIAALRTVDAVAHGIGKAFGSEEVKADTVVTWTPEPALEARTRLSPEQTGFGPEDGWIYEIPKERWRDRSGALLKETVAATNRPDASPAASASMISAIRTERGHFSARPVSFHLSPSRSVRSVGGWPGSKKRVPST